MERMPISSSGPMRAGPEPAVREFLRAPFRGTYIAGQIRPRVGDLGFRVE